MGICYFSYADHAIHANQLSYAQYCSHAQYICSEEKQQLTKSKHLQQATCDNTHTHTDSIQTASTVQLSKSSVCVFDTNQVSFCTRQI